MGSYWVVLEVLSGSSISIGCYWGTVGIYWAAIGVCGVPKWCHKGSVGALGSTGAVGVLLGPRRFLTGVHGVLSGYHRGGS